MHHLLSLWSFSCLILLLYNCTATALAERDACPIGRVITSIIVVKQTIHIMTNVPHDTIFEINTDLTITVGNALKSLDLIITFLSSSTSIKTVGPVRSLPSISQFPIPAPYAYLQTNRPSRPDIRHFHRCANNRKPGAQALHET